MTPREVLLAAADYLEANGWIQSGAYHPGGPACVINAFLAVEPDDLDSRAGAHELFIAHVGARRGIDEWNDAPGRTRDEVVRALREAAR